MPDRENVIKKAERIMCSTVDRDMIDSFCEDVIALLKEQPDIVRCKACGDCRQDGYCERWHISVKPDFFCADGDDGNLQEGT